MITTAELEHNYIEVTPWQSIQLFGLWDQPRKLVSFEHIRKNHFSWNFLRQKLKFSARELHSLQQDKQKWIQFGQLTLHDVMDMKLFPVNPLTDLCADLAEIWSMKWQPDDMIEMGISFDQLLRAGMTPQVMKYFNYTLTEWINLGYNSKHINETSEFVFGMPQSEISLLVQQFAPKVNS